MVQGKGFLPREEHVDTGFFRGYFANRRREMKKAELIIAVFILVFLGLSQGAFCAQGGHPQSGGGYHGGSGHSGGGHYQSGGGYHHSGGGHYHHGGGTQFFFGGYFGFPFYYPYGYYPYVYPPYYPYTYPYRTYTYDQPPVYVEPEQPSYWYYCRDAQAYYPYVTSCPGGWTKVVPTPPPAGKEDIPE
jgi:hypothetical protein